MKSAGRIIFFGDSITELGLQPEGYITLIKNQLMKKWPSVEIIGAGIGGNKVTDLQMRVDRDVIAKKPDIVFVYIGINDVLAYYYSRTKRHTKRYLYIGPEGSHCENPAYRRSGYSLYSKCYRREMGRQQSA